MNQPDIIQLTLPATHKYLSVLGASISAMLERAENVQDLDTQTYNIQLAAHEICANIVDHAYDNDNEGRIEVGLMLFQQPARFVVDLCDTGQSFDPATVSTPNLDEGQIRGYGLFLAHQIMDTVTYYPKPAGNHWRLVKNL